MAFAKSDAVALFDGMRSLLMTLGVFDHVGTQEPLNAPGKGINVAVTLGPVTTAPSGLASTSLRIEFRAKIFHTLLTRPLDPVDPEVLWAAVALIGAWSSAFTLSAFTTAGLVRNLDLLAATAAPAYLIQDGKEFRVIEVTMPVIVNDAFDQEA